MMVAIQALDKRTAELKDEEAGIMELREKVVQLNRLITEAMRRGANVQASAFREYSRSVGSFRTKVQVATAAACGSGRNLAEAKP